MANEIQELLKDIKDERLRSRLSAAVAELRKTKKFGLVFEEHLPELLPIYSAKVRVQARVARRDGKLTETFIVQKILKGVAAVTPEAGGKNQEIPAAELVVVKRFGEAIFPALRHVESVLSGGNAPHHTLIEADNYHALQILEWLYADKVDCIYIDPPYNTGAPDWKYNNNYVDKVDGWRHSKWLAMMQRRLRIAGRLLRNDGVLICTIDDNELAHLWMLLDDLFPGREIFAVTIQHNPGGTQGRKFSVTNEYALFVVSESSKIFRSSHSGGDTYNLRRWGSTSGRFEAENCFYPIYVRNGQIVGVGEIPKDEFSPASQTIVKKDGTREVWPLDRNGTEKKWRYARQTVNDVLRRAFVIEKPDRTEIILRRESEQPKTVWIDKRFNAEAHGTDLVSRIIGKKFPYPKSLYAVLECLQLVMAENKYATVLDFFSGSGTTLHATLLLNYLDGGSRRSIVVTNNEVSNTDSKNLSSNNLRPGDDEWESHGICRAITFPRCKYAINGVRDDLSKLEGDYLLGRYDQQTIRRGVRSLEFTTPEKLLAKKAREALAQAIGFPKSKVKGGEPFLLEEGENIAVLFEPEHLEDFLKKGEEWAETIETVYLPFPTGKALNEAKNRITNTWTPLTKSVEIKRPMSEGFAANLDYFRLDFLDRALVETGGKLADILPALWMMAGCRGKLPTCKGNEKMLFFKDCPFAVLVDESAIKPFLAKLEEHPEVDWAFLVTNDQDSFSRMCEWLPEKIPVAQRVHLWRNYVDNFLINVDHAGDAP